MPDKSIEKFRELTAKDPLFAAEGLDLENARRAVEKLEELAHKLEKTYKRSYWWFCFRHQFTETLYPIRFLKLFIDCEQKRRVFLDGASRDNAISLLSAYHKTNKAMRENAEAYREALIAAQKTEKFPKDTVFHFISTQFSLDKILAFTDAIIKNSRILEKEIGEREKLLAGADIAVPQEPSVFHIPQKASGTALLPEYKEALSWIEESISIKNTISEKVGPIYYEISQFDSGPVVHQFFAYILRSKKSGIRRFLPLLADRHYFIDMKAKFEKNPLGKFQIMARMHSALGEHWGMRLATQPYYSFDLRYYADLATILDLKRRPLNKENVMTQRSSLFDLILWDLYFKNQAHAERQALALEHLNEMYLLFGLFVTRTYPSIFFLTFNRSIWRVPAPLDLAVSIVEPDYFRTFEHVKKQMSPEEFKKLFDVFGGDLKENFQEAFPARHMPI